LGSGEDEWLASSAPVWFLKSTNASEVEGREAYLRREGFRQIYHDRHWYAGTRHESWPGDDPARREDTWVTRPPPPRLPQVPAPQPGHVVLVRRGPPMTDFLPLGANPCQGCARWGLGARLDPGGLGRRPGLPDAADPGKGVGGAVGGGRGVWRLSLAADPPSGPDPRPALRGAIPSWGGEATVSWGEEDSRGLGRLRGFSIWMVTV
jgi:hypothetical protein